jgi:hypothetical protein
MPRTRKNDPAVLVTPLVEEFARKLGSTLERFITGRIAKETRDSVRRGRPGGGRRKRARVTCYYPGCKNIAAPRFGMFCAALHKSLPKAEKEKYREQHLRSVEGGAPAKAARSTRRRGKR